MNTRLPGSSPERIWVLRPLLTPSSTGRNVGWLSLPTSSTPGFPSSVTTATVGTSVRA